MSDYSYIGSGRVYMEEIGSGTGLIDVGNVSELTVTPQEDVRELLDYTSPGGGTYNEVRRVSRVEMSMTMREYSPENIARVLRGASTSVPGSTVTDESHTAYPGAFIATEYPPDTISAVTDASGTTTFTEGQDYEVRPGGIFVLPSGSITPGQTLLIDYAYLATSRIEALVESGKEFRIFFAGLNEAHSGKEVTVDIFRLRLGVVQQMSLIGDDFGSLQVSGEMLKDTTKTGSGVSQYFRSFVVE